MTLSLPEAGAKDAPPLRDVLRQVARSTGRKPKMLADLEREAVAPEGWEWLLTLFWRIQGRVSATEIEAHARLSGDDIGPVEYEALLAMNEESALVTNERIKLVRKKAEAKSGLCPTGN